MFWEIIIILSGVQFKVGISVHLSSLKRWQNANSWHMIEPKKRTEALILKLMDEWICL